MPDLQLLLECREARSLSEHAAHLRRRPPYASPYQVEARLRSFAEEGLLDAEADCVAALGSACRQLTAIDATVRITSICIPTRNRPRMLARAMRCFVENDVRYDRQSVFVIVDDSDTDECRNQNRTVLGGSHARQARYADRSTRVAYVRRLARYAGVPESLVHFALVGDGRCVTSYGASRNALMVDTIGESCLHIDDDMVCVVSEPEGATPGLGFSSGDATEIWVWKDHQEAVESMRVLDVDFLACHEEMLGKPALACVRAALERQEPIVLVGSVTRQLLPNAANPHSRVDLSFGGIVGELGGPGWHHGRLMLTGASFDRLISDGRGASEQLYSRNITKCVLRSTLTDGCYCFTGNMGVSNEGQLPPFVPVQMMEDTAFGLLKSSMSPRSMSALIPYAIVHDPSEHRVPPRGPVPLAFPMNRTIGDLLARFQGVWPRDGGHKSFEAQGAFLQEVGGLRPGAFNSFVRQAVLSFLSGRRRQLEAVLNERPDAPAWWQSGMRDYIAEIQALAASGDPAAPSDLIGTPAERQRLFQDLLISYGLLLQNWGALMQAARALHQQGVRISSPFARDGSA